MLVQTRSKEKFPRSYRDRKFVSEFVATLEQADYSGQDERKAADELEGISGHIIVINNQESSGDEKAEPFSHIVTVYDDDHCASSADDLKNTAFTYDRITNMP